MQKLGAEYKNGGGGRHPRVRYFKGLLFYTQLVLALFTLVLCAFI